MVTLTREEQLVLVEAARGGDERAFARLHEVVAPLVRRSIARMVPESDLDDVVQEAMVKAYLKLGQFQGDASFSTWCVTIGRNTALMLLRVQRREAEVVPCSHDETVESSEGSERKAIEPTYEDLSIEQNLAAATVERGLRTLRPEYQLALRMSMDGFDTVEIAAALDCPQGSAKSYLHRAKKALAGALGAAEGPRSPADAAVARVRLCKCGCGEQIPARGWPYRVGHGKQTRKETPEPVLV